MSRRLLVVGAGRHQTPLIRRAEDAGIETVAIDYHEHSPGKQWSSHQVLGNAIDTDDVLRAAIQFEVDGVTTVGTDQALFPLAATAAALGLPCHVGPRGAFAATNKRRMRDALQAHGVRMPIARSVGPHDTLAGLADLQRPLVVKAADSQGQRGMTVVRSDDDLAASVALARSASRTGTVLVEEFRQGPEITINAWMYNGEPAQLAVLDRVTVNPPPHLGICVQHVFPTVHSGIDGECREIARRVAAAYGLQRGPLYIQCIVDDGTVYVIEAASRVGGGHEAQLLPRLGGPDLLQLTLDVALGDGRPPAPQQISGAGLVCFVVAHPGTFAAMSSFDSLVRDGIVDEGAWYVDVGHEQQAIVDSMGRVGYFIVTGSSREQTVARAGQAYEQLSAADPDGRELIFWPENAVLNAPRSH